MSMTDIDPLLGRMLGNKFEIRELLGVGAMGKVYRAHHVGLDKAVAIKVLIRIPAVQDAQARRFRREARAASRLEHPNTVRILDFGEETDGLLYIAMEYLQGSDLQDRIANLGFLPSERIAWIMTQVYAALGAAHTHGVIHRDVKPGNIMLVDKRTEDGLLHDFVKVCDFGLAKIADQGPNATGGPLTAQGAVFGTPAYMSPEQAQGLDLDARSDIYSAGVVMYKMMVGHTPFRAESPTGVLLGHIQEEPPPLDTWGVPVSPALVEIVERAMQKDPARRFQTASEARDALRKVLDDEGWSRPPITTLTQAPVRRHTDAPTEQVRLRKDQSPTEPDAQVTRFDGRPPEVEVATRYEDTRLPRTIAAEPPSRALQTLPPSTVSTEALTPPPARGTPWWAVLPGALALIGAGALVLVLARDRAPPPVTAQPPPAPRKVAPPPPTEAPPPAPAPTDAAVMPEAPPAPAAEPQPAADAPAAPAARAPVAPPPPAARRTRPVRRRATPPPPPAPAPVEAKTTAAPPAAPIAAPPAPALRADRGPQTPRPDPTPRTVAVTLGSVAVEGAISRQKSQDALARRLDELKTCLQGQLGGVGPAVAGELTVTAGVDERGRLEKMAIQGPAGPASCVKPSFKAARLPKADMGLVRVRFVLRYRTVAP